MALLAVAASWGATFVMVKEALDQTGPLTFVAFRFWLAALAMAPLLVRPWRGADPASAASVAEAATHDGAIVGAATHGGAIGTAAMSGSAPARALPGGVALAGVLIGICLFAGYALQTAGLQFTGAGRAGFITGLNVVIVPLLAAKVGRQRVGRAVAAGVALAAVGLGLLSLGDITSQPLAASVGDLLVLGCALAFALHIVAVGQFAALHDAVRLTFVQIATVAAAGTVAALVWERPTLGELFAVWPAAAFTGLVCTALAFGAQVTAQRFTSPTHTALVFSTEPVFGLVFAYWLGNERLGAAELGGCALILAGMVLAQLDE